jgi:hypothetical protein
MRQKIPALVISLLAAIFLANAINKAMPAEKQRPDKKEIKDIKDSRDPKVAGVKLTRQ